MKILVYLGIIAIIVLLVSGLVVLHKTSSGLRRAENPCSEDVIESHILSLTETYTEAQKKIMIPEIKKNLGCSE